ncbi:MAG TPA: septum site-determining protein MinC, partial [Aquirhabdus sp.]
MSDIRLNGKMVSFTRITLETDNLVRIENDIAELANKLYGMPVVIDATSALPLDRILELLRKHGLQPLAVIEGALANKAREIQFPVLTADPSMQRVTPTEPAETQKNNSFGMKKKPSTAHDSGNGDTLHTEVLRTGQRLVVDQGDIILMADMNSGAEVISAGSIHVYGTARGRLMAGASGALNVHIFCQKLEAELVSVSGTFCVSEDIPSEMIGQAVYIRLSND